jgi:ubiquinone/menaquinone biosynthesis C-methylase UbiE
MSRVDGVTLSAAAIAFDRVAHSYDKSFTHTAIGRAQRKQVWRRLLTAFPPGSRILELNCGTGEDARYLAKQGRSVVACDASAAMIAIARRHDEEEEGRASTQYIHIANENLHALPSELSFDGAFSNFSGLNCLADLTPVAEHLAELVRPDGRILLCLWSRICAAEILWFLLQGQPRKAVRRFSGKATANLGEMTISVFYPTVREVCRSFSPWFQLKSRCTVGLFVPPSYVEKWMNKHEKALARFEWLDRLCGDWPILRDLGDHTILEFVRCNP